MAASAKSPPKIFVKAFVALHNLLYRASRGRMGGRFRGGAPVLLLSVAGRKSGKRMTVPLLYVPTDRGYAVIASFAGSPSHPAWYLNLHAAGRADVQMGKRRMHVKAEDVDSASARYAEIWKRAVAVYPDYETYQARTTRRIPIVELLPEN